MTEKTRRELIFIKVLQLMELKQKSEELGVKLVTHIITTKEKVELVHLHLLEYMTLNELQSLYD